MSSDNEQTMPKRASRPKNLNPLELGLKLPAAGFVSLLHRISGLILFVMIPVVIFLLDISLRREGPFGDVLLMLNQPLWKLIGLGLLWAFCHHFFAGLRFLLLDVHVGVKKPWAGRSAIIVFVLSLASTAILGALLW